MPTILDPATPFEAATALGALVERDIILLAPTSWRRMDPTGAVNAAHKGAAAMSAKTATMSKLICILGLGIKSKVAGPNEKCQKIILKCFFLVERDNLIGTPATRRTPMCIWTRAARGTVLESGLHFSNDFKPEEKEKWFTLWTTCLEVSPK